jgi:hypothetical protein
LLNAATKLCGPDFVNRLKLRKILLSVAPGLFILFAGVDYFFKIGGIKKYKKYCAIQNPALYLHSLSNKGKKLLVAGKKGD